jgi:hypothetical protein
MHNNPRLVTRRRTSGTICCKFYLRSGPLCGVNRRPEKITVGEMRAGVRPLLFRTQVMDDLGNPDSCRLPDLA